MLVIPISINIINTTVFFTPKVQIKWSRLLIKYFEFASFYLSFKAANFFLLFLVVCLKFEPHLHTQHDEIDVTQLWSLWECHSNEHVKWRISKEKKPSEHIVHM